MEKSHEQIAKELCSALTLDYAGRNTNIGADGNFDLTFHADVDRMINHPVVAEALRVNESGLASAQFEVIKASNSEVEKWAQENLTRFWENDLHTAQLSYRQGWIGGELLYQEQGGQLNQVGIKPFHPLDVVPLRFQQQYAGIRVRNLREKHQATLKCGGRWPGRAFWHGHDITFNRFYGNSLLRPSHRDWQRLAERQGVEPSLDKNITRYAMAGPKCRYDERAVITRNGDGTLNHDANKDKWRRLMEDVEAGMAILLSSARHPDTKEYTEDFEWPEAVLNAAPILEVIKHYESRICYGIGTPRELMESVETGGWAGRNITMETFLATQQRYGRQIGSTWFEQIGLPLAKFHFGPDVHFTIKLVPLNKSRMADANNEQQPGQQPIGNSPQPNAGRNFSLPQRQTPQARLMSAWQGVQRRIKTSPLIDAA